MLLGMLTACNGEPADPTSGVDGAVRLSWTRHENMGPDWPVGSWEWTWEAGDAPRRGTARLRLTATGGTWLATWEFHPLLPGTPLRLFPTHIETWHPMVWSGDLTHPPLPLPVVAVDSYQYPHLLALLKDLSRDRFQGVVTSWPEYPVPVRVFPAQNDSVDLAATLREAMAIWNAGPAGPWFREDPATGWGLRLVHFPDRSLRPPARCRITRLDDEGRPMRVHIELGNDYDQPWDRRYALRALVHELGHGLLLWGHSRERDHVLWGGAPPLLAEPSADERKAALWWRGLPDGLDLMAYGEISAP